MSSISSSLGPSLSDSEYDDGSIESDIQLQAIEVEDQAPASITEDEYLDLEAEEDGHEGEGYTEEPLADAEWLAQYEQQQEETKKLEERLRNRLTGTDRVGEWCKCGNCNREFLQNLSECYCCSELDGCSEAMASDIVQQDLAPGQVLTCITDHPGFNPVCLQKWSLRLSGDKYKTKEKKRYRQTGSEERFLRSVSYREFSRLVYGILGNKRIPLPACAYTAIRKTFPIQKDEDFAGFDMDED